MKTREEGTNRASGLYNQPQILKETAETLDQSLHTILVLDCRQTLYFVLNSSRSQMQDGGNDKIGGSVDVF